MRLFVGLELPSRVKQQLVLACHGVIGARWQTEEQLHVTLRFIGDVDPPKAEDIDAALSAVRAAPFSIRLKTVGIYGEMRKPRVLWAGIEPQAAICHLHDKVESAMVRLGLPPEKRKYKPHVTLARFKSGRPRRLEDYLAAHDDFVTETFEVSDFVLYRSHLSQHGAAYEAVARYPLSGKTGGGA